MIAFLLLVLLPLATGPQGQGEPAPAEERIVRGRLLDALTGVPVEGASCELWSEDFDAPMELVDSVPSSRDGSFALRDPRRIGEKVRVRASGYRSTVFAGEDEVFLFPQGEPFVLRVVDLEGRPIPGATVRSHQTCQHGPAAVEGTSDVDGRVVLRDAPPFEDGPEYEVRAKGYGALTQLDWSEFGLDPVVYLPRRSPVALRLLDASGAPLAHRRFRQQGPGHIAFTTDVDGRAVLESLFESREIGLEEAVKEGKLHLFGWPALDAELTLQVGRPGATDGEPRADWPLLHVRAERRSTVHVQYGADSTTFEFDSLAKEKLPVPPGVPVVVLAQGAEVHRVELAPWSGTRAVDLTEADTRIDRDAPEGIALRFVVSSDNGETPDVSAYLRWPGRQREDEDPSPDGVLFHVPRGERWEVGFVAEGHVTQYRQGRAEQEIAPADAVTLFRLARMEVRGPVERIELAGQVRTSADGAGWNEFELAPGVALGRAWFGRQEQDISRKLAPGELCVVEKESLKLPGRK